MTGKIYVGIDIGKNGGIAILHRDGTITLQVTPTIGNATSKEIDKAGIRKLLENLKTEGSVVVIIEDVHSIFGAGAKSNFQFGRALGIVEGIVEALMLTYVKVSPKTWQKECFVGVEVIKKPGKREEGRGSYDTKAMAEIAARRLYPDVDLRKSSKAKNSHDGIVDALLMAHYAKLKY